MKLRARDLFVPKGSLSGERARLFAGRTEQIQRAIEGIEVPGATAIIYGDRGVGKSSFAWQLFELLSGNPEITRRHLQTDTLEDEFQCFWIECEERMKTVANVLLALLRPSGAKNGYTIRDAYPDLFTDKLDDKVTRAYDISLGIAKINVKVEPEGKRLEALSEAMQSALKEGAADPFELFSQVLAAAKKKNRNKSFIIFVDEFDRVPDRGGMGDFVKHCGEARTVIIGVAETAAELIGQHPSASRKLIGSMIEVPPLTSDEMAQIFENATKVVNGSITNPITFQEAFIKKAISASGGYPVIAQLLGYHAIKATKALKRAEVKPVEIHGDDFQDAATRALNSGDTELNSQLREAVGRSAKRANILDTLSGLGAAWVKVSVLRSKLNSKDQVGFNDNIVEICEAGFLERSQNKDDRVKFTTPVHRWFVLLAKEAGQLYPDK